MDPRWRAPEVEHCMTRIQTHLAEIGLEYDVDFALWILGRVLVKLETEKGWGPAPEWLTSSMAECILAQGIRFTL